MVFSFANLDLTDFWLSEKPDGSTFIGFQNEFLKIFKGFLELVLVKRWVLQRSSKHIDRPTSLVQQTKSDQRGVQKACVLLNLKRFSF